MELDRNTNPDGKGKYALIKLRLIEGNPKTPEELAAAILKHPDCVVFGEVGSPNEFFPIMLKDKFADAALRGYAAKAAQDDPVYSNAITELAQRAGENSQFCKMPD